MSLAIEVRPARETDCARLGQLRADSIAQLCGDDQGHDPNAIADWVGDGSARKFLDLLAQPSVTLIVAERGGQVAGLAARKGDFVTLNYVDPAHRFGGVSKTLMLALEQGMVKEGITVARLNSSLTALSFYLSRGWAACGPPLPDGSVPLRKTISGGLPLQDQPSSGQSRRT